MKRRVVQAIDIDGDEVEYRLTRERDGVERRIMVIDGRPERRPIWGKVDDLAVAYRSPSEFRAIAILLESPYV